MDDNISTGGTGNAAAGGTTREDVVVKTHQEASSQETTAQNLIDSSTAMIYQSQLQQVGALLAMAHGHGHNTGAPLSLTFQSFHGPVQNNYIVKSKNVDKSIDKSKQINYSGPVHNVNLSDNAALETLTVNVGGGGGDEQQMAPSKAKKSTGQKPPKATGGTAAAATKSIAKATPKKAAQKKAAATGVAQSSFVGHGISVGSRVQLTECGRYGVVVKLGKGKTRINYLIELEDSHETVWRVASKFIISKSIPPAGQN